MEGKMERQRSNLEPNFRPRLTETCLREEGQGWYFLHGVLRLHQVLRECLVLYGKRLLQAHFRKS